MPHEDPHQVSDCSDGVAILPITQATTATFTDLYIRLTFLFFIQAGSKRVVSPTEGELIGEEGDLLVFAPGTIVTMENRPQMQSHYRAIGVSFPDPMIEAVFGDLPLPASPKEVQLVRADPYTPMQLLPLIRETVADALTLPDAIRQHRLLEPLIWLREQGFHLVPRRENDVLSRMRRLFESDLERPWRAAEVAAHLAMSEPTMRRVLAKSGHSFAKTLLHTRLETGLGLLQTTDTSISEIALGCGFKTPSHFSDAFRKRFGIQPREIRTVRD